MGFLRNRRFGREICGWPFVNLGHFVEDEGEEDIPHFQETGRASRGGRGVTRCGKWPRTSALL